MEPLSELCFADLTETKAKSCYLSQAPRDPPFGFTPRLAQDWSPLCGSAVLFLVLPPAFEWSQHLFQSPPGLGLFLTNQAVVTCSQNPGTV